MNRKNILAAIILLATTHISIAGTPLGTAFTYQGQLKSGGAPYTGTADMQFTLYDAAVAGNIVAGPIASGNVQVANGLFTTTLDFGASAFNGDARWLQIAVVTPAGGGSYIPLTPRQAVTPAPYALKVPGMDGHSLDAVDGDPVDALFVNGVGNVGIGTTTPQERLHVFGAGRFDFGATGKLTVGTPEGTGPGLVVYAPNGHRRDVGFRNGDIALALSQSSGQSIIALSILENLNVGIGTQNPLSRLTVEGTVESTYGGFKFPDGTIQTTAAGGGSGLTLPYAGEVASYAHPAFSIVNTGGAVAISGVASNPAGGVNYGGYFEALGYQGCAVAGFMASPEGFAGYFQGRGHFSDNVGIGTTLPQRRLDVDGGDIQVRGPDGFDAPGEEATVWLGDANHYIKGVYDKGVTIGTYYVGDVMYVTEPYGWIGINTDQPQADLHVNGRTRTNVLEIVGGADLAEPFTVNEPSAVSPSTPLGTNDQQSAGECRPSSLITHHSDTVQPGMVVVIDPENPGQLKLAAEAYDRKVAGVISGAKGLNPGMIMRAADTGQADGDHPVALSGRVWCWCDAKYAPVVPGDRLTTSATPGHAMKVTDHDQADGAVLGKAMTSLEQGTGLVLVLVTLQ